MEDASRWVRITTPDGFSYIVERKVALSSGYFSDALSDDSTYFLLSYILDLFQIFVRGIGGFSESQTNTCILDERCVLSDDGRMNIEELRIRLFS